MTRPLEPLTAVLFDDGGLTRAGIARLARYADQAIVLGGTRTSAIVGLLTEMGVSAVAHESSAATLRYALNLAASSMPALVATGTPLRASALVAEIEEWQRTASVDGVCVHVLSAGAERSAQVLGWTPAANTWILKGRAAFSVPLGIRGRINTTMDAGEVAATIDSAREDVLLVSSRSVLAAETTADAVVSVVPASAVLHTILTDNGLTITNRTPFDVEVRVRLGAAHDAQQDLGEVEVALSPGAASDFDESHLPFFFATEPPIAEMRNWSHESEMVYDGGQRRINGVDVKYRDASGQVLAVASHGSHRGLVVGITAGDISRSLGASLQSAGRRFERAAAAPALSVADFARSLAG